ncbi:helix-turn-helix domain-containing protein [Nitrosomonas communis]
MYGVRKAGFKQREIANEVGVNKSTLSRELRRKRG